MNFKRGDIILVRIPFPDQQGSKIRPAIVVQSDHNNKRLEDLIVAVITSNTDRATREKTQLILELKSPAGKLSGLTRDSAIKCETLLTVQKRFAIRIIGQLAVDLIGQLDDCLKFSLDLQ